MTPMPGCRQSTLVIYLRKIRRGDRDGQARVVVPRQKQWFKWRIPSIYLSRKSLYAPLLMRRLAYCDSGGCGAKKSLELTWNWSTLWPNLHGV